MRGSPEMRRAVLADLALSIQTGAPPLAHLLGLHRIGEGSFGLSFDPARVARTGGVGIAEAAMLADLALGGVLRDRLGAALPMPTISLTLALAPQRVGDVMRSDADVTLVVARTAAARARLLASDGEVIGDATGVFAVPHLPYEGPGRAMPWDGRPQAAPNGAPDVDPPPWMGRAAQEISARSQTEPWATRQIEQGLVERDGTLALDPTAAMANRLGNVHGGALLGAAILAAVRNSPFNTDDLVSTSIQFIAAADLDCTLWLEPQVMRQGGRTLFTRVSLTQNLRCCGEVSMTLRLT